MNTTELQETLQKLNYGKLTNRELAFIWGIDETSVSRKKRLGTQLTTKEIEAVEKKIGKSLTSSNNEDEFIDIPVRGDVYASMGSGITVYNEEQTGVYKISRELARDIGVSLSNTQMIFASGDSMTPTIEGGDSLLIDLSKREVYDGRIYCVRIEGQLYAKRLQKIPPYQIKVISDNKEKYDPFYVDFSKNLDYDFEIIGEIRWWGRVAR